MKAIFEVRTKCYVDSTNLHDNNFHQKSVVGDHRRQLRNKMLRGVRGVFEKHFCHGSSSNLHNFNGYSIVDRDFLVSLAKDGLGPKYRQNDLSESYTPFLSGTKNL